MKDDLVEQVSATIKRLTRAYAPATPEELARAVLAIAGPAILEEAATAAKPIFAEIVRAWDQDTLSGDEEANEATGYDDIADIAFRRICLALAHTTGKEPAQTCPICAEPFKADDICAADINEGTCHAECLEGSPVVYLDTGEPSEGPIDTFTYGQEGGR